jgi:hypothetical protein
MLAGGGIGTRARWDGEPSLVLSCNHLKSPPQGGGPVSAIVSRVPRSDRCPHARIDGALESLSIAGTKCRQAGNETVVVTSSTSGIGKRRTEPEGAPREPRVLDQSR